MFGQSQAPPVVGDHAILLDGPHASFAFSNVADHSVIYGDAMLSWSWSSNVRHVLVASPDDKMMFLRRWDDPGLVRRFRVPTRGVNALQILREIESAPAPQTPDVIRYVLHTFRLIRQALGDATALQTIQILNGFLLATKSVRDAQVDRASFSRARTFGEVMSLLPGREQQLAQVDMLPSHIEAQDLGVLPHLFLEPEPLSGCELLPDLLFRHAASKLYQEAHLLIERDPQWYFAGMGSVSEPVGQLPKDVRFTPCNLARSLVQEALKPFGDLSAARDTPLVVLDPACGSGIFLSECLRELSQAGFQGELRLIGYDRSPISTAIARFCLELAKRDLPVGGMRVDVSVREEDSLRLEWDEADVILMNPPFIPWQNLDAEERATLTECLGDLAHGHIDVAMGFIWKATQRLLPGGVLASVLPAALLETVSGRALRERVQDEMELLLLGRFEGYKFFPSSAVETAFIVCRRLPPCASRISRIQVLAADEGSENAALRSLRLSERQLSVKEPSIDVFYLPTHELKADSWLPLREYVYELRELLRSRQLPSVKDLFHVRQGIRTGFNQAFVLSEKDYRALPKREKAFFRKASGQGAIKGGCLTPMEHVFYPYDVNGLVLNEEEQLAQRVPTYLSRWLTPNAERLTSRQHAEKWWAPSWPRNWQFQRRPKLVSTYFGTSRSFAYDNDGEYVVVQGYAWLWKEPRRTESTGDPQQEMHGTLLPWAYLALLNSQVFATILSSFCPRVRGGQFNLSTRFVNPIPMPDLTEEAYFARGQVQELAALGKSIHGRKSLDDESLNETVRRLYGLPADFANKLT